MKYSKYTILSFLFLLLLGIANCNKSDCINGEGSIVTQAITLGDFDGINLSGNLNIVLEQGEDLQVFAEGQQNIISYLSTGISNGIWNVALVNGCYANYNLTIHIIHPEIQEIEISGSGNVLITSRLDSLTNLDLTISGSGNIQAEDSLMVGDQLNTEISGSGNIWLIGQCYKQNINISGSGNYNAYSFLSDEAYVSIPGSGNAQVNVSSILDVNISGSGNVYYIGNPDISSTISGSGILIDAN
jgi:hypothetical protein